VFGIVRVRIDIGQNYRKLTRVNCIINLYNRCLWLLARLLKIKRL